MSRVPRTLHRVEDVPEPAHELLAEECPCPQRYRHRATRSGPSRAAFRGRVFAEAVREWHARPEAGVDEVGGDFFAPLAAAERWWLSKLLRRYVRLAATYTGEVLWDESRKLGTGTVAGARFHDRASLLVALDGEVEARVLTTGTWRVSEARVAVLLEALAGLAREHGARPVVREFFLPGDTVEEWTESPRAVALEDLVARHIAAEERDGPPVAGWWCAICNWSVRCPAFADLFGER